MTCVSSSHGGMVRTTLRWWLPAIMMWSKPRRGSPSTSANCPHPPMSRIPIRSMLHSARPSACITRTTSRGLPNSTWSTRPSRITVPTRTHYNSSASFSPMARRHRFTKCLSSSDVWHHPRRPFSGAKRSPGPSVSAYGRSPTPISQKSRPRYSRH